MVKVLIEVRSGAARFNVAVRAESIRRAMSVVEGRYPKGDVRVRFPIDPEGFFVEGPAAQAEIVGVERRKKLAA